MTKSAGLPCSVSVELFEDADESKALDDVNNRVDAIDTFPEETEKPVINLVSPERSVMEIAITGPHDERDLKQLGQQVRDEIASLPDVTQVELSNTRPYEISIEVSEASLRSRKSPRPSAAPPSTCQAAPSRPRAARCCCAPRARPTGGRSSRSS